MRKGYILLVTPTGKDELLTTSVLKRGGYEPVPCKSLDELLKNYQEDAGALVIAVEALVGNSLERLRELVHSQPKWSDIPVIMILYDSTTTAEKIRRFFGKQGSINFLERPLSTFALLNAVEIALRSRHRQFEVHELLEQREAARELAENESTQKDHFLAMLAHELRNPLSSIRNCLQILTQVDALENKKRAGEIVTIQMEHITRLVDDLLDVARIRTGKFQLKPELIELARILNVACESIQPMIKEREQHFHYEIPEGPIFINGDSVRIEEALLNLLNNASKYTANGGKIQLIASLERGEVRIRIQDNGQGIEKELQDSIFDPFFQANGSQERRHEGLGLGLFLVREIMQLHDGQIFLQSEGTNQGSEFEMRLPVATTRADRKNKHPFVENTSGLRYRILLIEDQALIAESMRMVLELSGSKIEWAGTGEDGIQAIIDGDYDAILIDIGLPDMTGYEVAQRVREMQLDRTPLLIALTGYGQAEDKKRATTAGFEAHYTKPVNEQDVFAFINSRLMTRESRSIP